MGCRWSILNHINGVTSSTFYILTYSGRVADFDWTYSTNEHFVLRSWLWRGLRSYFFLLFLLICFRHTFANSLTGVADKFGGISRNQLHSFTSPTHCFTRIIKILHLIDQFILRFSLNSLVAISIHVNLLGLVVLVDTLFGLALNFLFRLLDQFYKIRIGNRFGIKTIIWLISFVAVNCAVAFLDFKWRVFTDRIIGVFP